MSEEKPKRMAIIASKGTLDMAYPPLILASTAAAMDVECMIFYTFYGVDIVNKHKYAKLGMTALGTMMMKSMMGKINWPSVPELLEICLEMDVKMVACTPTLEMTGLTKDDLIEGVKVGGAADYLDFGLDANINLFV